MSWQKRTLYPKKTVHSGNVGKHFSSPVLMRFIGSIGFTAAGLGTLYFGQHLFNIDLNFWQTIDWGVKEVLLVIVSFLAALGGGFICAGMGMSIEVRSERINHMLSVLWHYLANGTIIWIILLVLFLNKILGKENMQAFVNQVGMWHFSFFVICIASCGSLITGYILLLTGAIKENAKPNFFLCLIFSLPIAMVMSCIQYYTLEIYSNLWLPMAAAFSVIIHAVSVTMMARDRIQRQQMLEN